MKGRDYDRDRAARSPEDFPDSHPGYRDDPEDDSVVQAKGMLSVAEAARRASSILSRLDKNDVDALYATLNPLVSQIGWFKSRYRAMQDKIWYLSDENERLLVKLSKAEQRLKDLGVEP